jgi:predicted dehydrogenase
MQLSRAGDRSNPVNEERLAVGVIGVGSLGFHHARLLAGMEDVELVGVHDSSADRLAEVSSQLSIPAVSRMDDLLARVRACVVAVPTDAHEGVACAALDQGVSVLIEKPIAPTLAAADRILSSAAGSGALVQIGHVERFNGALRACEAFIDEPLFVESHRLAPFGPRGTDVAVVLDLMIHDLDLVMSLMKRDVIHVAAVGVPVLTSSPDIANARLEFEGGGVANLTASRVSLERMRKIRFFQRSGYISLDLASGTGAYLRVKQGLIEPGQPLHATKLEDIVERVALRGDGKEPLRAELEHFVSSVRGEIPVAVTGEEGRRALAVALEIVNRIEANVADRSLA